MAKPGRCFVEVSREPISKKAPRGHPGWQSGRSEREPVVSRYIQVRNRTQVGLDRAFRSSAARRPLWPRFADARSPERAHT
jgi:hypothetical protein